MQAFVQEKKDKQRPGMSTEGELIGPVSDAYECPVSVDYEYDSKFVGGK